MAVVGSRESTPRAKLGRPLVERQSPKPATQRGAPKLQRRGVGSRGHRTSTKHCSEQTLAESFRWRTGRNSARYTAEETPDHRPLAFRGNLGKTNCSGSCRPKMLPSRQAAL